MFEASLCCVLHKAQAEVCPADAKYKVDLKDKKPLIKTIAIQYCTEHAPKNNEEEAG